MKRIGWMTYGILLLGIILSCRNTVDGSSIMAVDFGSEFYKVALVKPGIPMEIVLNKESKRKTENVIAIKERERWIGSEAASREARWPHHVFPQLQTLLGRLYEDPMVEMYRDRIYNTMRRNKGRGTIEFEMDGETYLIEELIAMVLKNAKEQAESMAKENVNDCVITVPRYFTQNERQAMMDAAELAGLNVLELMNEDTAVALHFALSRSLKEEQQYHAFYDIGAGSTTVTLAKFTSYPSKHFSTRNVTEVEIIGFAYDPTLGGRDLDRILQQHLANAFMASNKKIKTSVFDSPRAMVKLMREARRLKEILTINQQATAHIENLHEDFDMNVRVTKAEFDEMIEKFVNRVGNPLKNVLSSTDFVLDNLTSIVLVGGGTRVPKVQAALKNFLGDKQYLIAQTINADEAVVLGAIFRGASLSRQFRVKEVTIQDIASFPIGIAYYPDHDSYHDDHERIITSFEWNTSIPSTRKITLKKKENFDFTVRYIKDNDSHFDWYKGPVEIAKVSLTNLSESLKGIEISEESPKVHIYMQLDSSGFFDIHKVEASILQKHESLTGKLLSFFGGKKDKHIDSDDSKVIKQNETDDLVTSPNASDNSTEEPKLLVDNQAENKTIPIPITIPIEFKISKLGLRRLSDKEKKEIAARISSIEKEELFRKHRSESKNSLEAYIYAMKEYIQDKAAKDVSTPDQRKIALQTLDKAALWLDEFGNIAKRDEFDKQLDLLQSLIRPIKFRVNEAFNRDSAIANLNEAIALARTFLEKLRSAKSADQYHTETELEILESLCNKTTNWLHEQLDLQSHRQPFEDPSFTVKEIEKEKEKVEKEMRYLLNKPKPVKQKIAVKRNVSKTEINDTNSTIPKDSHVFNEHELLNETDFISSNQTFLGSEAGSGESDSSSHLKTPIESVDPETTSSENMPDQPPIYSSKPKDEL